MRCDYLLPTIDLCLTPNDEILECLRKEGHEGDHLVLLSDGTYLRWYPERCPDCDDPDCLDDLRCFVSKRISKKEAKQLLPHKRRFKRNKP